MLNPDVRRELFDRYGEPEPEADRINAAGPDAKPIADALWETWLTTTFALVTLGFSHRSLCDTVAGMAEIKDKAGDEILV